MKKLILFLFLLIGLSTVMTAQGFLDPVAIDVKIERDHGDQYNIIITANIDEGWHIYSQVEADVELAPLPTVITYNNTPETYELIGKTQEPDLKPTWDEVFEADIVYFSGETVFVQPIRVINEKDLVIIVDVFYSVCDDKQCLAPETKIFEVGLGGGSAIVATADISEDDIAKTAALNIDIKVEEKFESDDEEKEKSYLTIFLLGFIGGLIALLTPCVFPMIPLTVSFFTKSGGSKQKGLVDAVMYGFFIFLIYILLSLPFHLLDSVDPEILNNISTNTTLNVVFFLIFMVFAFSFFGYFEITLPNSRRIC